MNDEVMCRPPHKESVTMEEHAIAVDRAFANGYRCALRTASANKNKRRGAVGVVQVLGRKLATLEELLGLQVDAIDNPPSPK